MCAPRLTADPAADWLTITLLEGRTGLRLTGEADLCAVPALRRAVTALPPVAREILLQLAGLEFIDVAAARLLVILTERPGPPDVILHYPPLSRWPTTIRISPPQVPPWMCFRAQQAEGSSQSGRGSLPPVSRRRGLRRLPAGNGALVRHLAHKNQELRLRPVGVRDVEESET
jgi:hypothetical protein